MPPPGPRAGRAPPLRVPRLLAHRGASAVAPENTLAAFRAAARAGARWVEFDVRLARCGTPVVFHDDTLDRLTDGTGPLAARDVAALKRLDAGVRFGPAFAGERIPTLAEALAECGALGLGANIEIKPNPGEARRTARAALAALEAGPPGLRGRALFSSFETAALEVLRDEGGAWPRGLLLNRFDGPWRKDAARLGCVSVHPRETALDGPARVDAIRAEGLAALAFAVNDPARAAELFRWGVAAIFTDDPAALAAAARAADQAGSASGLGTPTARKPPST